MLVQDKIKQLAREEFVFEQPEIILSAEKLEIEVQAGTLYQGSLTVSNRKGETMQGAFYVEEGSLVIRQNMFLGKQSEIKYEYDALHKKADGEEKGSIVLVSNVGELRLPYHVKIINPYCETSLGKLYDLFHFTSLAKSSWQEAFDLFNSPEFERVFIRKEREEMLYKNLLKSHSVPQAMEEFLIAIHKKMKLTLSFSKKTAIWKDCQEDGKDVAEVKRDGWGYGEYQAASDQPFLTLEKEYFTAEDFVGNTYLITYYVHPALMHEGKNFARICLKTSGQKLYFVVEADRHCDAERLCFRKKRRQAVLQVYQNYIALRLKRLTKEKYERELNGLLEDTDGLFPSPVKEIFSIHLSLLKEEEDKAQEILRTLSEQMLDLRKGRDWEAYAAYYYLQALSSKKDTDIKKAIKEIQRARKELPGKGIFLWYLFYLDSSYDNQKKISEIASLIEKEHTASPILYLEAMQILNENPELLDEYQSSYEKMVVWGIKNQCVNKETALKFVYLSRDRENVDERLFMNLYGRYAIDEILELAVEALIKKDCKDERAFLWYDRGIRHKLKVEELYEYYMYAVPKDFERKIPSSVLLYFRYDNHLEKPAKAFLYAYLLKKRDRESGAYTAYEKEIRQFAMDCLYQGEIDENLSVLYQEFIDPDQMRDGMAVFVSRILFKHSLAVDKDDIKGIHIAHKELNKTEFYPCTDGKCYADIYTENALYFAEDRNGNLFSETVPVVVKPLFSMPGLAERCYESCKTNTNLLLHLFEKIQKYQKNNESGVHIRRRLMLMPGFRSSCQGECYVYLIEHYLERLEVNSLKEMLQIVEIEKVPEAYLQKLAEYCIIYEQMEKAERILDEYGFQGVSYHQLSRFVDFKLKNANLDIKSSFLLRLCYYIFDAGKETKPAISYLLQHFSGSRSEMLRIFRAAAALELNTAEFEERLLSQMIVTENYGKHAYEVFRPYCERGGNPVLIKAFLAYNSFKYLVFDRPVPDYHFVALAEELTVWESLTGHLAMLKYLSMREELTQREKEYAEEAVGYLVEKEITLPFLKKFFRWFPLPQKIQNHFYVEYHTQPGREVKIHYFLDTGKRRNEFTISSMREVYFGIYVKEFILFADESLQYYISEMMDGREVITESRRIALSDEDKMENIETGFGLINLMLTAREMQDEKTMFELMEYYAKLQYMGDRLFTPL